MKIEYASFDTTKIEEVKAIYSEAGWYAYLQNDEGLVKAFDNSLFCLGAFNESKELIGFIRCVGDGIHIVVVQDLIISKKYQRQGIGRQLLTAIMTKYVDVRMFQVVTDINDEKSNAFYQSLNMKPLVDGQMISYIRLL